jgi:hypothetical protein
MITSQHFKSFLKDVKKLKDGNTSIKKLQRQSLPLLSPPPPPSPEEKTKQRHNIMHVESTGGHKHAPPQIVLTADVSDRQWGSTNRCQTHYFLDNHAALSGCCI